MKVLSSKYFTFDPPRETTIASIGSGPGAELVAVYQHFEQREGLHFLAIDRVESWRSYIEALNNDQFQFRCMDIREFDTMATCLKDRNTSCVIFSHVLVDFTDPNSSIIHHLFDHLRDSLRCVIVLDRYPQWYEQPRVPNHISVKQTDGDDRALLYTFKRDPNVNVDALTRSMKGLRY